MRPRFEQGQRFTLGGIDFSVSTGRKGPGDLVLWWSGGGAWHAVPMSALAMMFDFFEANERVLMESRPEWRNDPEEHLARLCHAATVVGWEKANSDMVARPRVAAQNRP